MKVTLARIMAVSMLLVALAAAPAEAHTRTASTSLTLKVSDTRVDRGDRVIFRGKLRSGWKKCRARQTVTLYRGNRAVQSKMTNRKGRYKFARSVKKTKVWRVRYAGRAWGVHPHDHQCLASSSRGVRVRVR